MNFAHVGTRLACVASATLFACLAIQQPAQARDLIVSAARPNVVFVVDAQERKVIRSFSIPNSSKGNSPIALVPSKDGKVAYVIHNRWETVSGIDLESGKEVFRAELSTGAVRGKAPFAIDLSPDGKELAVFVNPTQLLPGEYRVQDPYIAIFRTDAGIEAQPVRKLVAPRRVTTLAYSPRGDSLFAFSWDMLKLDPQTGAVKAVIPWRTWKQPNRGAPDTLAIWPNWEQTKTFVTPYFIAATDKKADDPASLRAGVWAFDLANETVKFKEFENASVVLFNSVENPVRRNEVYTVYTTLTRTDLNTGKMDRVDLAHTYYDVNVSSDGSELYIGGTEGDIAVYDTRTLKQLASIKTPGGGYQVLSSLRMVRQ